MEEQEGYLLQNFVMPSQQFSLFGHDVAENMLLEDLKQNHLHHAYLICGSEGIGKATLAYRAARFLLSHQNPQLAAHQVNTLFVGKGQAAGLLAEQAHPDAFILQRELDVERGVLRTSISAQQARKVSDFFNSTAAMGGYRVAIVDAADDLNVEAANALLKVVEEPPTKAVFFIVAHNPGLVLPTIRSRCRRLNLRPLNDSVLKEALIALSPSAAEISEHDMNAIISRAEGSVRRALELLDQDKLKLTTDIETLLLDFPKFNTLLLHRVAESLQKREAEWGYLYYWRRLLMRIREEIHLLSADGKAALPYLMRLMVVWDSINNERLEADALNLDKRLLIVNTGTRLSQLSSSA